MIFPVAMSSFWRRWFSTVSSTIWRSNKPPPCCPASSSRRTYEQTHTNTYNSSNSPHKQIFKPLPNTEINGRFPFPHIQAPIAFLASPPALQPKQKPEVDVCLCCLMKPVLSMRQTSVRWFNKPFLWPQKSRAWINHASHSGCLSFVSYSNALSERERRQAAVVCIPLQDLCVCGCRLGMAANNIFWH